MLFNLFGRCLIELAVIKWNITNEVLFFVLLYSFLLPQLFRNDSPTRFLVDILSYRFFSGGEELLLEELLGEADELLRWEGGTKGQDKFSSESKNCSSSYFLLNNKIKFVKHNGVLPQEKYELVVCVCVCTLFVHLPNKIRAILNGRMWFWFFYVTWQASFILLIDYCISAQLHQSIHLFICPFI